MDELVCFDAGSVAVVWSPVAFPVFLLLLALAVEVVVAVRGEVDVVAVDGRVGSYVSESMSRLKCIYNWIPRGSGYKLLNIVTLSIEINL